MWRTVSMVTITSSAALPVICMVWMILKRIEESSQSSMLIGFHSAQAFRTKGVGISPQESLCFPITHLLERGYGRSTRSRRMLLGSFTHVITTSKVRQSGPTFFNLLAAKADLR